MTQWHFWRLPELGHVNVSCLTHGGPQGKRGKATNSSERHRTCGSDVDISYAAGRGVVERGGGLILTHVYLFKLRC